MSVKVRTKLLSDGTRSLYLDIYQKGRRHKQFLGLRLSGNRDHDKEATRLADMARSQTELDIYSSKHALISTSKGKIAFVEYCRSKTTAGRDHIRKCLPHLEAFDSHITLESVDERFLNDFREYLLTKVQKSTASTYFNGIVLVLNLAVKDRAILRNPAQSVDRIKVPEKARNYLSAEEVQLLAETPIMGADGVGGEIKKAFLFACLTGLRWSDLVSLTRGEVRTGQIQKQQQKTGRQVVIPISDSALQLITTPDTIHRQDERVFQLPPQCAKNRYITLWAKKAGIERGISFHTSRHTAATLLLESGADLFTVQRILGHTKADQTMIYAKVTDPLKRKAVEGLPKIKVQY